MLAENENETRVEIYPEDMFGALKSSTLGDLQRLPQVILNSSTKLLMCKKEVEALAVTLESMEETYTKQILDSGLYSNQAKRDLELKERLGRNDNYKQYRSEVENLKKQVGEEALRLDFYNNKFKAARAIASLIGD